MRYYYVELNADNVVKAALDTCSVINKPNMIQTETYRDDLIGWSYQDGQFYPPVEN